jgi:membrane protease YdiL (CAAX protease family)
MMSEIHHTNPICKRDIWLNVIASILLVLASGLVSYFGLNYAFPSVSKVVLNLLASIFSLVVPIAYLSLRDGAINTSDFYLRKSDFAVLFASFIILVIVVSIISLGGPYKPYTLHGQTISKLISSEYFIGLFSICFILPFLEETLFRRYIFEIVWSGYKVPVAFLFTIVASTVMHASQASISGLVSIFLWEIFFTLIYFKSRLGVSIIIHCITNISLFFM